MRAASDPRYRRIVIVCGSQMGKTESLLNILGHRFDDDPAPAIYVAPTQRQVESISNSRVMRMLKSTPSLYAKLEKEKTRNKASEKYIAGQRLGFAWAGSATELSSHPAALVLVDERDRMESDVQGEGDPVTLAEARTATYPDGKIIVASTPTVEGASPIWSLYLEGTQAKWSWPCPECETYFVPELALLKWPEGSTPQQALRNAALACPACGSLITSDHTQAMNARGRYELLGDPESTTASFWISGLASPWRTFGQAAMDYVEAAHSGEVGRIQGVKNTKFGELFSLSGEAPDWQKVAELRGGYEQGTLPEGARVITAGVDVQKDRLVYVIRGWGSKFESWLLKHGEFWGDTDQEAVWTDLDTLLDEKFGELPIRAMFVDSGFRADMAYAFARRHSGRAYACKGHDALSKPLYASKVDISWRGKIVPKGLQLWHVDSNYFKSWVYSRIDWPADQPGAWHVARDATDDYCQQVVAEQKVVKANGQVRWIRTRKDNHFLDCEMLNAAAAHLRGASLAAVSRSDAAPRVPAAAPTAAPISANQRQPGWMPHQRGWFDRYR